MSITLIEGGVRLTRDEELALNYLLRREGGEHEGMQLYKLGWAVEDNAKLVVPICFHENQCSYHLLSWEPPSVNLAIFGPELKQDVSKGTYNCITHFLDAEGKPMKPTAFLIERAIPILKRAHVTAMAALRGEKVILERMRSKKKEEIRDREKAKEREYESYVDSVLNDNSPAFSGNPMSGSPSSSNKTLSDIRSGPVHDQPDYFDFTVRVPKPSR